MKKKQFRDILKSFLFTLYLCKCSNNTKLGYIISPIHVLQTFHLLSTWYRFLHKKYSCIKPEEFGQFDGTARQNSSWPGPPFRWKMPEIPAPAGILTESGRKVQLRLNLFIIALLKEQFKASCFKGALISRFESRNFLFF